MRAKQCIDLQVQLYIIRSHFNTIIIQQNNSIRISTKPMTCQVLESQTLWQCQVWLPFHRAGLQSNQKVVSYSHNICVTIVLVYFTYRPLSQVTKGELHDIDDYFSLPVTFTVTSRNTNANHQEWSFQLCTSLVSTCLMT